MLMQVKRYADGGDVSSVGLAKAISSGLTQTQYDDNIRAYIAKTANPLAALNTASEYGVSMADINRALGKQVAADYFTTDYNTETAPSTNVATGFTSQAAQRYNAPGGLGQARLDAEIKKVSDLYAANTPENAQILRDMFIQEGGSIADLQRAGFDPSRLLGTVAKKPTFPTLPIIPAYTPPVVTPETQTQFPQPTPYTPVKVYQPLPAPPPIYGAGQPALDVAFRNSPARTYDPRYGYVYSPAAKLLPATGAGMSFTPPSVTSRPRSLLNVPLPVSQTPKKKWSEFTPEEKASFGLSASQVFAREESEKSSTSPNRFAGQTAPTTPAVDYTTNPNAIEPIEFRFFQKGGPVKKPEGSAQEELTRLANGGSVATGRKPLAKTDPLYIQTDAPAPRNPDAVARPIPKAATPAPAPAAAVARPTPKAAPAAAVAARPTPMSQADLIAQIDRSTASTPIAVTPERDPVKTESAGMLARLNQAFYENVSKPAVGTLIDMTAGLGDLVQMGTKYVANRAGIETEPFTPVSPRIQEAAGTAGYDPYTLGGVAASILPFARGQQAASSLRSAFPNIGRETAAYGGGEAGAAAASAALPDSTAAELFGSFVGGTAGSIAGAPRTQIDGPRIPGEEADELTGLGEPPAQPGTAAQMLEDVAQIDDAIRPTITTDIGDRRRVGTTGRYVGAPEGVNTQQKLGALTRAIKNLTKEGEFGKFWYERSGRQILDLTAGNKDEAEKIIQAIAITSARTPVATNFDFALQAYYQWKNGEPISTGMYPAAMGEKLQKMFDGEEWAGRKTNNFYNNLMREVDPSKVQGVTTDLWMMRAFGFDTDAPTDAQYSFVENETKRIAQDLGWEPQQVQAAIWVALKSRMENTGVKKAVEAKSLKNGWLKYDQNGERVILDQNKHAANWLDTAMKYSPNDADREAAKFDYATAAQNNLSQISWETRPSRPSGHLPEIFDATPEAVQDYHVAMSKAFLDDQGKDIIAQELGILSPGDFEAPGYFEELTSPGTQTLVAAPKAYGLTRRIAEIKGQAAAIKRPPEAADLIGPRVANFEKYNLDSALRKATYAAEPAAMDLMMAYAAVRGILLKQDGVGLHKPSFLANMTRPRANGIEINIGRPLTAVETAKLAKLVAAGAGHTEYNPIGSANGVRFINFEYVNTDNSTFQKIINNALKKNVFDNGEQYNAKMFGADTGYLGNNWKENLNGERYLDSGDLAGRPDLQRKIRDIVNRLAPRVSAVEDEFANRYGWTRNRELNRLYEAADEAQIAGDLNIPPTDGGIDYVTKKANGGDVFPVKSNASSSRRMLDDLIGKKPEGQRVDASGLQRFANGGSVATGRKPLSPTDPLYIQTDAPRNPDAVARAIPQAAPTPAPAVARQAPMSSAELLAQIDRSTASSRPAYGTASSAPRDPVQTDSRNMLRRLSDAFGQNVTAPVTGAALDMTAGVGDLLQMGAKAGAKRLGIETKPFSSVSSRLQEELGVAGYDPYSPAALAASVLLPAAGPLRTAAAATRPMMSMAAAPGSARETLSLIGPILDREASVAASAELAAMGARELAPDNFTAEIAAAIAGGGAYNTLDNILSSASRGPTTSGMAADDLAALTAKAPTDTPEFKNWFGNSAITTSLEPNGKPRRLYHITPKNFDTFDVNRPDALDPFSRDGSGPVIFMTDNAEEQMAAHKVQGYMGRYKEGSNVMPVYASIQNPLFIDNKLEAAERTRLNLSQGWPYLYTADDVSKLKAAGYDGVFSVNDDIPNEIVAFRPEQVKSAIGNEGTFDPANPVITKAQGGYVTKKTKGA
jgi:hypothetical protein